jgi:hypothetical protein
MQMLSEDDLNLRLMSDEELDAAWDLWFDLAQETNAFDPPYSHGVLVGWAPLDCVADHATMSPSRRRSRRPAASAGPTPSASNRR